MGLACAVLEPHQQRAGLAEHIPAHSGYFGVLVAVTGADCAHVDASACSADAANPNCAASVTHRHGGH
jgi:hypothetical protein